MRRGVPAAVGVTLSALVALGAAAGVYVLVAALILVVVVVATGWPGLLSLPTQRGSTTIIALCGAVAIAVVTLTETEPFLRWLPVVLALSVIVAFWHQLLRRDMRPRLVDSVTGVVAGVVVVELAAGWVAALRGPVGEELVLLGAAASAAAAATTALPCRQRVTVPAGLLAGAGTATLLALALSEVGPGAAAAVGGAVAVVVVVLDRLLGHVPATGSRQAAMAASAASVAAAGTVVFLVGRFVSA